MLSPTDMAVIGASFKFSKDIDFAGFLPEWLEDNIAKEIVSAMLSLSRQGKAVNPLNVMATARGVPKEAWGSIIAISKNGDGGVDWKKAIESSRESYIRREVTKIHTDIQLMLKDQKALPSQWLPRLTMKIDQLMETGKTKDANPKALFEQTIPQIKFYSLVPEFGRLIGGGYRDGMLVIYAGCTGHGKSTALMTHACDCLIQGKRVSAIVNELMPQMFFKRVLRGVSGLYEHEIENKKGDTPENDALLHNWLDFLEERLRVYDKEMYAPKWMERVVAWDKPDALIVDYIKDSNGDKSKGMDAPGDMAFSMLDLYRSARIPILTAGQMSDTNAKAFIKNDNASAPIIYGSARCQQASTIYAAMKRDNYAPNTQYFRKHKDSLTGIMDTEERIGFDQHRFIYNIKRQQQVQQ